MPHNLNHDLCTYSNFSHWAIDIVRPAYYGINGGVLKPYHPMYLEFFTNNFYSFLNGMWSSYNSSGCDAFVNRFTYGNERTTGPSAITDDYQIAITKAQMLWAQKMHSECGCSGPLLSLESIGEKIIPITKQEIKPPPPPPQPPPTTPVQRTSSNTTVTRTSTAGSSSSSGSGSGY